MLRAGGFALLLSLGVARTGDAATLLVQVEPIPLPGDSVRSPGIIHDLQAAIDTAADGDTIRIGPGLFEARPTPFLDPWCGNCEEHRTPVAASVGWRIAGKRIALVGAGPEATTLATGAGYGIYVEDSEMTRIVDLAVTGGRRDADGNATDAAIVARRSRIEIENLHLRDNTDRAEGVTVGIGGVMGREGAELEIRNCWILNNGWDGVALYRGATATIADNRIEQGRGAGIGITWDAVAVVLRNRVSGYWKGIGTFGQSCATVRNNAVYDNLGWGVIATGESFLEATHNVIARNGNCGLAVWSREARGFAANNIILENGWRDEWVCPRVGIWHAGAVERFAIGVQISHSNVEGDWKAESGDEPPRALLRVDPLLGGEDDFRPNPGSPAIDAGEPPRTDGDGSAADLGLTGGPCARVGIGAPPPSPTPERERVGSPAWRQGRD